MPSAQRFEVGVEATCPGQDNVRGHRSASDVRVASDAGRRSGGADASDRFPQACPGGDIGVDESVEAGGWRSPRSAPACIRPGRWPCPFIGAGDEHSALAAVSPAALGKLSPALALRIFGFVDLHQAVQRRAVGRHHVAAKLGSYSYAVFADEPSPVVLRCRAETPLEWAANQVGGPGPGDERHLRAVHHRAGGHRGWLAATCLSPEASAFVASSHPLSRSQAGTPEAVRPAGIRQIRRKGALVGEAGVLNSSSYCGKIETDGCSSGVPLFV